MIYLPVVLLLGACTESDLLLKENEPFAVHFSTVGIGAEITTRSTLAENVPLRILAFRRVGDLPDLSVDEYIAEGTYKVEGGNGVLSPVSSLLLRAGTYDFYALTPDLAVSRTGSTDSKTCTVSVGHGRDYAASLTESKAVSESAPQVALQELSRHCTKLTFALAPKSGAYVTAVDIVSAGLTNMTDAPVVGKLLESLPVDDAICQTPVSLTGFTAPDNNKPLELSASTIVLPRKAGAFDYQMKVKFNGSDKETELVAHLPQNLAFQPGYSYTFTVKLKGGSAILELTVAPWNSHAYGTDMGEADKIILKIGEWTNVAWDGPADTGGGNTTLTVSGWEVSDTWSDEMGRYPGLTMTSGGWENTNWGSHADTGGGNIYFNPPAGWTERPTHDTNGGSMGAD